MLWATLLHDIKKKGPPLFEGKDHIHPFTSSCTVLETFKKLDLIS